jgi:hypothetical protein
MLPLYQITVSVARRLVKYGWTKAGKKSVVACYDMYYHLKGGAEEIHTKPISLLRIKPGTSISQTQSLATTQSS